MKRHFVVTLIAALGSAAALAATPHYSYLRTVDLGTTASGAWRATTALADADGMMYITNNTNDHIGYFNPLTANAPADVTMVYDGVTPSDPFDLSSFMGMGIDDDGVIYASGCNDTVAPTSTNLLRIQKTGPTAWTKTFIAGISGPNGGTDATGTGIIGLANVLNGAVSAYLTTPFVIQLGTPEPAAGVGDVIKVQADVTNVKGYQSIVSDNQAGRVDIYNQAVPYDPTANPLITSKPSSYVRTSPQMHYQQISLDRADQVLCVSVNRGTQPGGNAFELYNVAQTGKNLVPYQTISRPGSVATGAFAKNTTCYGSAFFSAGADKYLFVAVARTGTEGGYISEGYVFKQDLAGVDTWGLY